MIKIFILFFLSAALYAQSAVELLGRIDARLSPESYESYRKLINEEPGGRKKEFIFYSVKKGRDKMAMLYLAPASEKGRTTLRSGDNMWLYIPNVGKPVRITSLQSITGGVFNNADIMQVDYAAEYDPAMGTSDENEYTLILKAKNKTVAYDKLIMRALKKNDIITRIECFAASGMLIKTLEFKEVKDFGSGIIRPAVIETTSPLYQGYKSVMIYSGIKLRTFGEEVFSITYMPKLESLRR